MAHLRHTKSSKISNIPVKDFPLILEENYKVHWLSLSFFLNLYKSGTAVSSILTYAHHIVDLISQLEVDSLQLDQVDDEWLKEYKETINSRLDIYGKENTQNYSAQVIRSTIHFLFWLEDNKYIRGVVGDTDLYKVRIKFKAKGIYHPLSNDKSKDKRKSITPRTEWIDIIKEYGPARDDLSTRFELMIDWGKVVGLRAMEACHLTIDLLPQLETAKKAILDKKNVYITLIVTKGSVLATIPVSPLLVKQTWEYINSDRALIINKFEKLAKQKYEVYQEPEYVFLSDKSGSMLNPRSFSNSCVFWMIVNTYSDSS